MKVLYKLVFLITGGNMPNWLQKVIAYLQVLNTPPKRRGADIKVIYERIPGTDREILARTIHLDGTEVKTIIKVVPSDFKP